MKAFGKRVNALRIQNGFSQEQLANDADMPINQVGRIERGEINTTISSVYALSNALNVPTKDLFDFSI
jgi:transcriptional regulator with XRE-family HTH domain